MMGSVSDSYDPEWGTSANAEEIGDALDFMHERLTYILKGEEPIYILKLVDMELPNEITATLTEKEWRILRFAVERAMGSL